MDITETEKIHCYNMAAESNLQLSVADKELLIKDIEKEFPRTHLPKQIVPDDFIDCCDDVSFLELYEDWKSIYAKWILSFYTTVFRLFLNHHRELLLFAKIYSYQECHS